MNRIYQQLGNGNMGPFGNFNNLLQKYKQFESTFKGNAQQQVQQMLNSGQMSQNQYNMLQSWANQFQKMIKSGN